MSALPSHPSTKGYTPVPLEERIDDDVETPRGGSQDDDQDDLYMPSAPLLSARSGGNELPRSLEEASWCRKILTWRPFPQNTYYSAWDPPRKGRNWRKITFWSFFGTLVAAVIALATSTGVLASKMEHQSHSCYRSDLGNYRHTRVPFNDVSRSSNWNLNFPLLYPPIKASQTTACGLAWRRLRNVPCHEKIWNRSWDNGKPSSIFDPDISLYAESMCSTGCVQAIDRALQLISSQCTEGDKFDTSDYFGTFATDAELEDGPLGVITTLHQRLTHACRREPNRDYYSWRRDPYCTMVMWEDWSIVDGMYASNLEGLEMFEKRTRERKEERSHSMNIPMDDRCDNIRSLYSYRWVPARRFGPDVNSTTCGWCTMNWFERKLMGWKEGKIIDPKGGKALSLQEYLQKIRHAGERCDADAWDLVWLRALRKYKLSRDLPTDWDGNEKTGDDDKEGKPGKKPCTDEEFNESVHTWETMSHRPY